MVFLGFCFLGLLQNLMALLDLVALWRFDPQTNNNQRASWVPLRSSMAQWLRACWNMFGFSNCVMCMMRGWSILVVVVWLLMMVEPGRWGCHGWRKGGFTSMGLGLLSWMWVWVCRGSRFASTSCFFYSFFGWYWWSKRVVLWLLNKKNERE